MLLMKSLRAGGKARHYKHEGREDWPLPHTDGTPGNWLGPVSGSLKPHGNGFHLARLPMEGILWTDEQLYIAEIPYHDWEQAQQEGNIVLDEDCLVVRHVRLVEKLEMSEEAWHDLAFRFAQPAVRLPEYLGMPHEYMSHLQNLFFWLRDGYAPLAHKQDPQAFLNNVDAMIERCNRDARHTIRHKYTTRSVKEAAIAIRELARLSPVLGGSEKRAVHAAMDVANIVRDAYETAALSFEMAEKPYTNRFLKDLMNYIPEDMPQRYRRNIASRTLFNMMRRQNSQFIEQLGVPELISNYHLASTFETPALG